tara:strand:- start:71 stop:484 length:414 start_codon:yes stop_codon:yes gene_type:complete
MTANLEVKKWASDIAMKHGNALYHNHKLRMDKIKNGPARIDTKPPREHPIPKRRLMESIHMAKKLEKENIAMLYRLAIACQHSCIDNKLSNEIHDYREFTKKRLYREKIRRAQKITYENRVLEKRISSVKSCLSRYI